MTEAAQQSAAPSPAPKVPAGKGLGKLVLQYLPGQILPSVIGFAGIPILTRLLSPEQYGYYVLVFTIVTSCNTMAFNWVGNSALRFYRPMEDRKPTLFLHLFVSLLLTTLALAVMAGMCWPWLSERYRHTFLLVGPLVVLAATVTTLNSTLRAQSRAVAYSLATTLNAFLRYAPGILALVLIGASVDWLVLGWTLGIAFNAALLIFMTGAWRGLPKARLDPGVIRDFLSYGAPMLLVGLTNVAMSAADKFIIDIFRGETEVGLYGLGFQLGSMPIHLLGTAIMLAVFPKAVDAHEEQQDYSQLIYRGLRYLLLAVTPVLAVLGLLAPELLVVYSGKSEFIQAAPAMRLVLTALVIQCLAHYYRMPFMVHRRTRVLAVIGLVSAAVGVAMNLLLVPWMGFVGSAWALLAAYSVMLGLSVVLSCRLVSSAWPLAATVRSLVAVAVGCLPVVWAFRHLGLAENLTGLAVAASACGAAYGMVLYLTGETRRETHVLCRRLWARARR